MQIAPGDVLGVAQQRVDAIGERAANGPMQPDDLCVRQRRRLAHRRDARAKQRLVGVDVADASDHRLIQQRGFDGTRAFEAPGEHVDVEAVCERLGPKRCEQGRCIGDDARRAQVTAVGQRQRPAAVGVEREACESWQRLGGGDEV